MSNPLAPRARRGEEDFYCSGLRRGENEPRDMRAESAGARRFGYSDQNCNATRWRCVKLLSQRFVLKLLMDQQYISCKKHVSARALNIISARYA
jgi:hypothetical protein